MLDIADLERKLGIEGISAEKQLELVTALQQSAAEKIAKAKSVSIGKGAELVVQGLKKIKSDMEQRFAELDGNIQAKVSAIQNGRDGKEGKPGREGKQGPAGAVGPAGATGAPGKDGIDGANGVSVANARIDFDGSLIIMLDDGTEINAGEVVPFDVAEKFSVITNGGGTSQTVIDALERKVDVSFETISKNLKALNGSFTYTSGVLTSINYGTILKTLNYTSGVLTSIVLSGAGLPSGISLTKTLGYTSGVLTSITYS
jgi:hypothetical protein